MNQKKAKALRRRVYGDLSTRPAGRDYLVKNGTLINHPTSPRSIYQSMKKLDA